MTLILRFSNLILLRKVKMRLFTHFHVKNGIVITLVHIRISLSMYMYVYVFFHYVLKHGYRCFENYIFNLKEGMHCLNMLPIISFKLHNVNYNIPYPILR